MFSQVFDCHSVQGLGGGSHKTITHDALDLTVQGTPPFQTSDLGSPSLPTSVLGPPWWSSLDTCSKLLIKGPLGSDIWWMPLKHVRFQSRQHTSYWNAFLCFEYRCTYQMMLVVFFYPGQGQLCSYNLTFWFWVMWKKATLLSCYFASRTKYQAV